MKEVLIGAIVAVSITILFKTWQNQNFPAWIKVLLTISFVFPPALVVLFIIFYGYFERNSKEAKLARKLNHEGSNSKELKILRESGIISEDEYNKKLTTIISKQGNLIVENTSEYNALKKLYDNGLISQNELSLKKNILISRLNGTTYFSSSFGNVDKSYILINNNKILIPDVIKYFASGKYLFSCDHIFINEYGEKIYYSDIPELKYSLERYFPPK